MTNAMATRTHATRMPPINLIRWRCAPVRGVRAASFSNCMGQPVVPVAIYVRNFTGFIIRNVLLAYCKIVATVLLIVAGMAAA